MRSPKKEPFSKSRKYSQYKLTNWSSYNRYLRKRGRLDFMIADDLSKGWYEEKSIHKKRGRRKEYSDLAIIQCLKIRFLFCLKLRQTKGFINHLFELSGFLIKCPDYSVISRRCKNLGLSTSLIDTSEEFDHISMDSTGIQTYTGNEWLENKHGKRYIRRIWKKIHIAIDDKGRILASSTTDHKEDDRSQIENLLDKVNAKEFLGDPGYDGEKVYQLLRAKGMKPTIRPPNHLQNIKFNDEKTEREKAVDYQQNRGYQAWRVKNKYGRREKVENTFFRFKTSFGCQFLSREEQNMANEMIIKCQLLNRMFEIGRPESVRVA